MQQSSLSSPKMSRVNRRNRSHNQRRQPPDLGSRAALLGRLPDGRRLRGIMAMDVTERKQVENELRDSQEQLRSLQHYRLSFIKDAEDGICSSITALPIGTAMQSMLNKTVSTGHRTMPSGATGTFALSTL